MLTTCRFGRPAASACLAACLSLATIVPAALALEATSVDAERQRIVISISQEPPQLNSTKATDQISLMILGHVMEGLLRYDRRNRLAAGVAERWQMDDQGATFHLREDARWSDGKPVTAHDFVYAWQTVLDPATASEYAFVMYPIKNAEAINRGELPRERLGAVALDNRTLQVTFERPTGHFDKLVAFGIYYPVREDFHRERGERYAADAGDLLYNGPFRITEWVHSASLKMVKQQHYWNRDIVHLNEIDVGYITADTQARFNLFKDGKVAFTEMSAETMQDALKRGDRIRTFNTGSVFFIEFNHRPGRPTVNANLRRALLNVFDTEELVNKVMATPGNLPAYSLFPVWLDGVNGKFRDEYPVRRITPSVEEGKRYLALARDELDEIPPLVLLCGDTPTAVKQAEYMQGLFRNTLGLDVRIDVQTFKQRLAKMTAGEFDLVAAGWGPDFDDALTFGDLFASWNLNNRGRYANPALDAQVRRAMGSSEPQQRMAAFAEIQRIIVDDAVIIPQYEQGRVFVHHPKLRGMVRRAVGADPDFTHARVMP